MKDKSQSLSDASLDRAFSALAADDELRLADRGLEQRVLAEAGASQPLWSRPAVRIACKFLAAILLTSGALAATGGWTWISNWWYSIRIDGDLVVGHGSADGPTEARFTTADGVEVHVAIERTNPDPDSKKTRIEVLESSAGFEEASVFEERRGTVAPPAERLPLSWLDGSDAIHTWRSPADGLLALHLISDRRFSGSILVVQEVDSMDAEPVIVIQRTARRIGPDGSVRVVERDGGMIEVELDDGRGWALAIVIGASAPPPDDPATTLITPSGRVRVDVEGDH